MNIRKIQIHYHKKIQIYYTYIHPLIIDVRKLYIHSSINSIYYGCKIYLPNNSYIYSYLLTLL